MCNFANYYLIYTILLSWFRNAMPNHKTTQPQFKIKENTGVRKIYSLIIWIILKNGLLLHP